MKMVKIMRAACCLSLFLSLNIFSMKSSVQVFFSGVQPLLPKILELVNGEKKQIDFAQYTLLHPEVVSALLYATKRGIKISGVVDQNSVDQIGKHILLKDKHAHNSKELFDFLKQNEIGIYARYGHCMHNKIMCFSQNYETDEPVVITGSANCTISGLNGIYDLALEKDNSHNFENLVVIKGNHEIYEQYRQEINKIKMEVVRQACKGCKR